MNNSVFNDHPGSELLEPVSGALELQAADYLADMEGLELTETQKVEVLETLWLMLRFFVENRLDIGKVDPCGQLFGEVGEFPIGTPDDVKSVFSNATEIQSTDDDNGETA